MSLCLAANPLSFAPLASTPGLFLTLQLDSRRPMDPTALRPRTNPSKPSRRASRRVVEQHPHRRDDQYHAVGMHMLDRPWTAARHWLASLVSRTRQLDGDSAEPIDAAQPLVRGQGSEVTLQEKGGRPRNLKHLSPGRHHQARTEQSQLTENNRLKHSICDPLTCLLPPICKQSDGNNTTLCHLPTPALNLTESLGLRRRAP